MGIPAVVWAEKNPLKSIRPIEDTCLCGCVFVSERTICVEGVAILEEVPTSGALFNMLAHCPYCTCTVDGVLTVAEHMITVGPVSFLVDVAKDLSHEVTVVMGY